MWENYQNDHDKSLIMFESTATIRRIMVKTSMNTRIHETYNGSEYSACMCRRNNNTKWPKMKFKFLHVQAPSPS